MNRMEYNVRMKAVKDQLAEIAQLEDKLSWQKYKPDQNFYGDLQEGEGIPVSRQIGQGIDAFASGMASGATMGVVGQSQDPNSRFGRAEQAHPIANVLGDIAGAAIPITPLASGARLIPGLGRAGGNLISQMARAGAADAIAGGAYGGIKAGLGTGELSDVPKEAAMWGAMGAAMPVVGKGARYLYNKIKGKPKVEVLDIKDLPPEAQQQALLGYTPEGYDVAGDGFVMRDPTALDRAASGTKQLEWKPEGATAGDNFTMRDKQPTDVVKPQLRKNNDIGRVYTATPEGDFSVRTFPKEGDRRVPKLIQDAVAPEEVGAGKISTEPPKATPDAGATPAQSIKATSGESFNDPFLEQHFRKWNQEGQLEGYSVSSKELETKIRQLVNEYPDITEKHGWSDIRDIALRNIEDGIGAKPTELGAGVNPKKLWEKLPQSFRNIFTGAKNRVTTDEGKKVVSQFEDVYRERGVLGGEIEENLREVGLNQLNHKQRNMLSDALQGKAVADEQVMQVASGAKSIIEKMHNMATDAGMNIGKIANYFPRMIKSDIAVALNGDLAKMTKGIKDLNLTDQQYIELFRQRALAKEGISKYMQEAIAKAQAEGKDVGEYLYSLHNEAKTRGFLTPFGNLEKSRTADLPSTFYETDAGIVLGRYINGWSRRVAETKHFGQDMAGLKKQLTDLTMAGNPDAQELRKLAKVATEVTEFENALSPTAAKWVRRGTNLAVTTKIGTGFATLLQATQPLISIIPKAGVLRTIQGGLKLLDPAVRKSVRQSGAAPFADAVGTLTGQHLTESLSSRITNAATTASGFKGANKMLQYLAASTGKIYIENLHKIARGTGSRAQWAAGQLKKFGINSGEALSNEALEKGMFQFAMDSQLQRNALRDPIWMNDPKLRPLALFKRFGFRQAEYIKNDIIGELSEGKNIFPLLRLGAGAYVGGEFAIWAKNELTEIMTGKEQYRASDPLTVDRFLENIAAVGALGTLSDLTKTDEVTPWKKFGDRAGNVGFSLLPAIGSEVRQGLIGEGGRQSFVKRFADIADRKGPAKAFARMFPDVASSVSPIGGRIAQRFESDATRENQYKYLRGKESARIAYLLLNGGKDEAMSRLKKWNATNPRYAIKSENISNAAKSLQESLAE